MVTVDISIELKEQYYQAFLYNFSLRVGDTVCNQLATLFFLNPHYFNAHAYMKVYMLHTDQYFVTS